MAFQSVWYYTDLPEDIVDIIERDVSETFDEQMETPNCMEMFSTREKELTKCLDSNDSLGRWFLVALYPTCNENFLYDLRCIDGESMQYTRYKKVILRMA